MHIKKNIGYKMEVSEQELLTLRTCCNEWLAENDGVSTPGNMKENVGKLLSEMRDAQCEKEK